MQPVKHLPHSSLLLTVLGLSALTMTAFAQDDGDRFTTANEKTASTTATMRSTAITQSANSATGFPTLTGPNRDIPTYPAPSVPPTENAPFMKQSSAPAGTVFIAVGAILGAFALAILLWRAIVSLLLHRSVERAAMAQHTSNGKTGFPAPPAPFYKYTDRESTMSLGGGGNTTGANSGRGNRRTNRGPVPSANLSNTNLFFSPTAAASNAPSNRNSTFLPSGFYAANSGTNSPGQQQQGHAINLSNLRPDSRGHYVNASRNTLSGVSPPDSPPFSAQRDMSSSSINLSTPLQPGQRAPSAYLEDLLADDPSSLPPPRNAPNRHSTHR